MLPDDQGLLTDLCSQASALCNRPGLWHEPGVEEYQDELRLFYQPHGMGSLESKVKS